MSSPAAPTLPTPSGLPRGVLIMVGLAAITVTVAGVRAVSDILAPVLLAVVLSIASAPIRSGLAARGVPRWVGTVVSILAVYVVLVLLTVSLVVAAARFASLVPEYQDELSELLAVVTSRLADLGVGSAQAQAVVESFDLGRLAGLVTGVLASLASLATDLAFVVTLVLFLSLDAGAFGRHLAQVRTNRPAIVEALESFASGTRTYLLVSTGFGLVVAVIDTVLLYLLGIPGALLWGLLAFITNYIPNIGFVLGLVPPAVLALLEGGPGLMLAVIVSYSVVNVVIQSVIQPKMVGDAVGLSASVTFLSLVVWSWILGPLGAVLAVPLSLLVRAVFVDVDPATRWIGGLIGSRPGD
ncbi:AI-2E family transporter [Nocardioides panacisoli]|uniref:AI-2E family transporter n=1 Tax=Nocardioides panacisoli TaxID=627624 RepID=UPI001C63019C|nr:AI-2E family transporter [Nocardioides panacisoli]QYJ04831.1 AI-2E family transporter [Nocardioides panacisoli]